MTHALACVQPTFTYVENKFWSELLPLVNAFKAACLFGPTKVIDLHPDATMVEDLKAFTFLEQVIPDLQMELPVYLATAEGVSNIELQEWWKRAEEKLPHWAAECRQVFLCQPSSAAVERVFSTLNNCFGDDQSRALEDYIELSLMLQHNKRSS